jgi:hypothetical protein
MLMMKTYGDIDCTIFTQPKPVHNHLKFGRYFTGHSVLRLAYVESTSSSGRYCRLGKRRAMKDNCLERQLERLIINPLEVLSDHSLGV